MKKYARRRLIFACTVGLLAVVLLCVLCFDGLGGAFGLYEKGLDRHARLRGGIVDMVIEVTDPLKGDVSTVTRQTILSRTEKGNDPLMKSETTSQSGENSTYSCSYFDGEQLYTTDGNGWFVYTKSYYENNFIENPFFDLGPEILREYVTDIKETKAENSTELEMTADKSAPGISLSLPIFSETQTVVFRPTSYKVALNRDRQLTMVQYIGTLTVSESIELKDYNCTMTYQISNHNGTPEVTKPETLQA